MRPTTVNSVGNWIRTLTVVVLAGTALPAAAQSLPVARLFSVYPPGARQGASLDVTIAGVDLDGVSQLHFSTPGITATQKTVPPGLGETTPQPAPGQFTIQVAADAKPGLHLATIRATAMQDGKWPAVSETTVGVYVEEK